MRFRALSLIAVALLLAGLVTGCSLFDKKPTKSGTGSIKVSVAIPQSRGGLSSLHHNELVVTAESASTVVKEVHIDLTRLSGSEVLAALDGLAPGRLTVKAVVFSTWTHDSTDETLEAYRGQATVDVSSDTTTTAQIAALPTPTEQVDFTLPVPSDLSATGVTLKLIGPTSELTQEMLDETGSGTYQSRFVNLKATTWTAHAEVRNAGGVVAKGEFVIDTLPGAKMNVALQWSSVNPGSLDATVTLSSEPSAPTGVKAERNAIGNAVVSWDAGPSSVAGYVIYRKLASTGTHLKRLNTALVTGTEFIDIEAKPYETYDYSVQAFNTEGLSSQMTTVTESAAADSFAVQDFEGTSDLGIGQWGGATASIVTEGTGHALLIQCPEGSENWAGGMARLGTASGTSSNHFDHLRLDFKGTASGKSVEFLVNDTNGERFRYEIQDTSTDWRTLDLELEALASWDHYGEGSTANGIVDFPVTGLQAQRTSDGPVDFMIDNLVFVR